MNTELWSFRYSGSGNYVHRSESEKVFCRQLSTETAARPARLIISHPLTL